MSLKVKIFEDIHRDGNLILFTRYDADTNKTFVYSPVDQTWTEQKSPGEHIHPKDFLFFPSESGFMQMLADALYKKGFKPSAYVPSKGEMDATIKHLEDMRAIVGKNLGVKFTEVSDAPSRNK